MNEKVKYRLDICLIHLAVYLVALLVPWMFIFEMLTIPYAGLSVLAEVCLYIAWSLILALSAAQAKKDIVNYTVYEAEETLSKRMWKVIFTIMRILLLLTLAYLILTLIFILISFMV